MDLDETLVHSSFTMVKGADIVLQIEVEGHSCPIYVLTRPGLYQFLERMTDFFEVVIFTASLSKVRHLS